MTLKEAITLALDFERKVRDHYFRFAKAIEDPQGRKVFERLGAEEQGHVDYLEFCLSEWQKSGKVPSIPLKTALPKGKKWVQEAQQKLQARPGKRIAAATELEAVKSALEYEKEADGFYRKFVAELPESERGLFTPFLEIEDGHLEL